MSKYCLSYFCVGWQWVHQKIRSGEFGAKNRIPLQNTFSENEGWTAQWMEWAHVCYNCKLVAIQLLYCMLFLLTLYLSFENSLIFRWTNTDTQNWNLAPTEKLTLMKIHTFAMEKFWEVPLYCPKMILYGEVGRRPLYVCSSSLKNTAGLQTWKHIFREWFGCCLTLSRGGDDKIFVMEFKDSHLLCLSNETFRTS